MADAGGNGSGNVRSGGNGASTAIDRGQNIGVLRGSRGPIPAADPARTHRFCLAQHPQFLLTFSDDMPQKIRLRKRITAWPLRLTLHADYSRRLRGFQYGFTCTDVVLKGSVHLDVQSQQLQYRKLFNVGNGAALAVTAGCHVGGLATLGQQPLHPVVGVLWLFGGQGAARWARDGKLDLRRRIPLTRNFGIEACGTAELPLPRAQYAMRNDESQFSFGSDDDTPFHLHLDQLNLCFDL